jgi:hypothetical protein
MASVPEPFEAAMYSHILSVFTNLICVQELKNCVFSTAVAL